MVIQKELIQLKHDDLIEPAVNLLKISGKMWKCTNVFTELATAAGEEPDAFGIGSGKTSLVEVKVTRSDFHAGKKKIFRQFPHLGMGNYRFYLCPEGLILPEEIYEKWGLAYWTGKKVKVIVDPEFQESCQRKEIAFVNSVLRRIKADELLLKTESKKMNKHNRMTAKEIEYREFVMDNFPYECDPEMIGHIVDLIATKVRDETLQVAEEAVEEEIEVWNENA